MPECITWIRFQQLHADFQTEFENLCRLIFKHAFAKNHDTLFAKTFNNPGIETDPILINGERIGFQAKFFTNSISYSQIEESTDKIVEHYNGKIDKVIFFCNKDLNDKTPTFLRIIKKLASIGATHQLFCNDCILDLLKDESDYANIRSLFFSNENFNDCWFDQNLDKSLSELSPRYEKKGLHVGVQAEAYIHSFYRDSYVFDELIRLKKDSIESLKNMYSVNGDIRNQVFQIIQDLKMPERNSLENVFEWKKSFETVLENVEQKISDIDNEIKLLSENYRENETQISNLYYQIDEYKQLYYVIDGFDLRFNNYFKYLNEKILLVEGDAGTGKSHLLGYMADISQKLSYCKTILLLGHKFLFKEKPSDQICKILGLKTDFADFLNALEAKGELEGKTFIIMIDAINECDNYPIWKSYINELVDLIESKVHVKLIMSIRSTYKKQIFNEAFEKRIEKGAIPLIRTNGFVHNLVDAIPIFFEYYKIPLTIDAYFGYEFENPLFLKMFCESYAEGDLQKNDNLFNIFLKYVYKYEKQIKLDNDINPDIIYGHIVFTKIGEYFFKNNIYRISYFTLLDLCSDLRKSEIIIDGFIKSKIFLSYHSENDELYLTLNYQRFSDFAVALYLSSKYKNDNELSDFFKKIVSEINDGNNIKAKNMIGYVLALSILKPYFFDLNINWIINDLKTDFYLSIFFDELIECFALRSNYDINKSIYYKNIFPIIEKFNCRKHIELLTKLSLRKCELNSTELFNFLENLTLCERDYIWTIYLNDNYEKGNLIYDYVNFPFNHDLSFFKPEELKLYILLLGEMLSSSHRELRDKASKALVLLMKDKPVLMLFALEKFLNSKDPYIVSRIAGCCYGSLLNSNFDGVDNVEWRKIAQYIFDNVFNKEIIYEDILFRDYSLNILEFLSFKGVHISFDMNLCRPPYKSKSIPKIDTATLNELYKNDSINSGLKIIKFSMMPELTIEGFGSGYGDFGRYTFDSALHYFDGYEKEDVFKYAFYYVVAVLGYKDSYFNDYDKRVGFGRYRTHSSIERIGKKYEWITMYHILSLISDNYPMNTHFDEDNNKYKGSWNPCIRDFDPTLTIDNMDRTYDLELGIYWNEYKDWDFGNKEEWISKQDFKALKSYISLVDSNENKWIAFHFDYNIRKEIVLNRDYESVWGMSTAILVKKEDKVATIEKLKNNNFYGRWFRSAELNTEYRIFLKEYVNSPAFCDLINNEDFAIEKIPCGKEKKIVIEPIYKKLKDGNFVVKQTKHEIEVDKYEETPLICCSCMEYLWEEECDFSKKEAISLYMPSRFLINIFNLKQREPGLWYLNNELVCVNFHKVKNSNVKGLYIRETLLDKINSLGYELIWIGMGEKVVGGDIDFNKWYRADISSLIWTTNEEIFEENIYKIDK